MGSSDASHGVVVLPGMSTTFCRSAGGPRLSSVSALSESSTASSIKSLVSPASRVSRSNRASAMNDVRMTKSIESSDTTSSNTVPRRRAPDTRRIAPERWELFRLLWVR